MRPGRLRRPWRVLGLLALAATTIAMLVVISGDDRPLRAETTVQEDAASPSLDDTTTTAPEPPGQSSDPGTEAAPTTTTAPPSTTSTVPAWVIPIKGGLPKGTTTTSAPSTTTTTSTAERPSLLGKIVFVSDRSVYDNTHDQDLWVMDSDGSNQRQLTQHQGADVEPDLSPDGTRLVWLREEPGYGFHLMVMDADGSNERQITTEPDWYQYPSWSPDGSRILYNIMARGEGGVGLGPAGKIYTVAPDGTDVRVVFETATLGVRSAAWAPDGQRLVVDTNGSTPTAQGIWVITLADGQARQILATGAHSPAWSPDGSRIAFVAGSGGILTVRPDGNQPVPMTISPENGHDPAWSADGRRLIYTSPGGSSDIHSVAADGTDTRVIAAARDNEEQATS